MRVKADDFDNWGIEEIQELSPENPEEEPPMEMATNDEEFQEIPERESAGIAGIEVICISMNKSARAFLTDDDQVLVQIEGFPARTLSKHEFGSQYVKIDWNPVSLEDFQGLPRVFSTIPPEAPESTAPQGQGLVSSSGTSLMDLISEPFKAALAAWKTLGRREQRQIDTPVHQMGKDILSSHYSGLLDHHKKVIEESKSSMRKQMSHLATFPAAQALLRQTEEKRLEAMRCLRSALVEEVSQEEADLRETVDKIFETADKMKSSFDISLELYKHSGENPESMQQDLAEFRNEIAEKPEVGLLVDENGKSLLERIEEMLGKIKSLINRFFRTEKNSVGDMPSSPGT